MILTYNKEHVGDVLMAIVQDDKGRKVAFEPASWSCGACFPRRNQ